MLQEVKIHNLFLSTASVNKSFIRIDVHINKYMYISINISALYMFKLMECTQRKHFIIIMKNTIIHHITNIHFMYNPSSQVKLQKDITVVPKYF